MKDHDECVGGPDCPKCGANRAADRAKAVAEALAAGGAAGLPPGYGPSILREHFRLENKYGKQFEGRSPRPYDLFRLAETDPLISSYVKMWQAGDIAWEAMLVGIVTAQHATIQRLMDSERRIAQLDSMKNKILIVPCPKCGHAPSSETPAVK